jgi:hypothetical protein
MCVNTCLAYVSKYKDVMLCPECTEDHFRVKRGKSISRHKLYTLPIGPTIQTLYQNPVTTKYMHCRCKETLLSLNKYVCHQTGQINVTEVKDIMAGEEYLWCITTGVFDINNTVLLISIDSAQIYRQKELNCWIYIWVLMDLPPHLHYKKEFVIPGAVIPGPNTLKLVETFLYPGLAHIASLQHSPLKVWDVSADPHTSLRPSLLFLTGVLMDL